MRVVGFETSLSVVRGPYRDPESGDLVYDLMGKFSTLVAVPVDSVEEVA